MCLCNPAVILRMFVPHTGTTCLCNPAEIICVCVPIECCYVFAYPQSEAMCLCNLQRYCVLL